MTHDCAEMELLLHADLDGELDAAEAVKLARHSAGCPHCTQRRAELVALQSTLRADLPYHVAPDLLRARLTPRRRWPIAASAVAGALAASLAFLLLPQAVRPESDLLSAHLRALQPGHLLDVASNEQHNVKPWFDGKIDYAPPVKDLSAAGFPLDGGRLDYLGGRPVAVLVYRRQLHVIDLFVWPTGALLARVAPQSNGYQSTSWAQDGFSFVAVSDLNAADLAQFKAAFQSTR